VPVDEALHVGRVARPGSLDVDTAHEVRLGDETVGDAAGADDAEPHHAGVLVAQLGARDALGALEVDDLAVVLQVVELAQPVGTDREDVDVVPLDVVDLLALVLLDDHLIGEAALLDILDPVHEALLDVQLAAGVVEVLGGDGDDQVVAEGAGAFEEASVPVMEQVECSVGDDAHGTPRGRIWCDLRLPRRQPETESEPAVVLCSLLA
jgi:hypothetical protein